MLGMDPEGSRYEIRAVLSRKVSSSLGRVDVTRTKLEKTGEGYLAKPIRTRGSSILTSISKADGLIIVPENKEGFSKGDEVKVSLIQDL